MGGGGSASARKNAGLADLASAIRSLVPQPVQKIDFGGAFENVLGGAAPADRFEGCYKWLERHAGATSQTLKVFAARRAVAALGSDAGSELDDEVLADAGR